MSLGGEIPSAFVLQFLFLLRLTIARLKNLLFLFARSEGFTSVRNKENCDNTTVTSDRKRYVEQVSFLSQNLVGKNFLDKKGEASSHLLKQRFLYPPPCT